MKQVLWVSRHEMTGLQRADLERIMGAPVHLIRWEDTVHDVSELVPSLRTAAAIAAVLPPELLAKLLDAAGDKPVLRAVSRREPTGQFRVLPDGRQEQEFAFVHGGWEQILQVDIKTRRL